MMEKSYSVIHLYNLQHRQDQVVTDSSRWPYTTKSQMAGMATVLSTSVTRCLRNCFYGRIQTITEIQNRLSYKRSPRRASLQFHSTTKPQSEPMNTVTSFAIAQKWMMQNTLTLDGGRGTCFCSPRLELPSPSEAPNGLASSSRAFSPRKIRA